MTTALGCFIAYVLGGVPFALVVVWVFKGKDLRRIGSGNVGATNGSRAFSTRGGRLSAFVLMYALDAAKGFVPACCGPGLLHATDPLRTGVLLAASAVLGHVFSPFLRWKGGKGVATATGALLALDWLAVVVAIAVFLLVRWRTGQVFFGSLALGTALALASIALHLDSAFGSRLPVTILCVLLAGFLFFTHRSNLAKYFAARRGVQS
jgi:glycerol-3-phosphate acyltransferase PlsY